MNGERDSEAQIFGSARRPSHLGTASAELHLPDLSNLGHMHPQQVPSHSAQQGYQPSRDMQTVPNIAFHQAPQDTMGYSNAPGGATLPDTLQPGHSGRPGPSAASTAPSAVPTLPHLSTHSQPLPQPQPQQQQQAQPPLQHHSQYTTPVRQTNSNHSHNYSRSSPAGFEGQKYTPFSTTPDTSKLVSPQNPKYTPLQAFPGPASNSPLALADIRPRADSGMSDGPSGGNQYIYDTTGGLSSSSSYLAPWPIYAFDWCKWPVSHSSGERSAGKVAIGSYLEDGHNFIQILDTKIVPQAQNDFQSPTGPSDGMEFVKAAEATHSFPVTRLLWEPPSPQKQSTDLLATSGDHLRLWSLPASTMQSTSNTIHRSANSREQSSQKLTPLALLSNSKSPEHTAPLTSLDWNILSPSLIITSSIDTTCTIWDIPTLTAKTQLIAHDKEVFDVRFCANSVDVFVSCGADGSVRMFDLRSLDHSTIIYEPSEKKEQANQGVTSPASPNPQQSGKAPQAPPLLRLAASPFDAHLLATFSQDSSIIRILDIRQPGQALLELQGHNAAINCIEWSPSTRGTLASGGDDSVVLLWDLLNQTGVPTSGSSGANGTQNSSESRSTTSDIARGPSAAWSCDYEVGNISFTPRLNSKGQGEDWLGVSGGRGLWGVKL